MKAGEYSNWAELPPELTSSILQRLGAIDILENAQKVCMSWRRVCKIPSMWRKIDMRNLVNLGSMNYNLEIMCRHAVDRSQEGLSEIHIWYFGTDHLLNYIADNSSHLRSLKLAMCDSITVDGFTEAVVKLPLLEELKISHCSYSGVSLRVVGQSCPNLKTLKLNRVGYRHPRNEYDGDALAIAETMPGLHHLQLFGNRLSDAGLTAILDSCPKLEHLDIRQCFNINLVGNLEKQCSERIKVMRRPHDSTHDYPFDTTVDDMFSSSADFYDDRNGYYSESNSSHHDLPIYDSDYADFDQSG